MTENDRSTQKCIADELDFGPRTVKRATWGAFAFRIVAPLQIEVTNEGYGPERNAHQYTVTVDDRADGLLVPIHCTCAADQYNDTDCKHKLAVVVSGGLPVLGAAAVYTDGDGDDPDHNAETAADCGVSVATDGGEPLTPEAETERARAAATADEPNSDDSNPNPELERSTPVTKSLVLMSMPAATAERPDACCCWNADADLPCWPCWRAGFREQNPAEPRLTPTRPTPSNPISLGTGTRTD